MKRLLLAVLAALLLFALPAAAHARHHHRHHRHHHHRLVPAHITPQQFLAALSGSKMTVTNPIEAIVMAVFGAPHAAVETARTAAATVRYAAVETPIAASRVLAVASRFLGDGNITGKPGRWCKWFVNFVLRRAGFHVQGSGMARDSRLLGPPTGPHPGAIAYNSRHTAFVAAVRGAYVLLLGGNQHHRVSYIWWRRSDLRFVDPVPI